MSDTFDKEFTTLRDLGEGVFVLRGSTIIVEIQAQEEIKTKGGLIVATDPRQAKGGVNAHRLDIGKVLMTGPGYWNEDGGYEPLDIKPGAIVILPQYATQQISVFPGLLRPTDGKLGMVKDGEVLAYYPSQEAFEKAKAELN